MTTTPSFRLKWERAVHHLDCLQHEITTWGNVKRYEVADEDDPDPPRKPLADGYRLRRLRVVRADPIPPSFGLLVGDCLFNLRSALDHLALALARRHTTAMTERQVAGSEFPIFGNSSSLDDKTEGKKIGCLAPAAKAAIKLMQPYQLGADFATHPLWIIHDLNRIDKHRALHVVSGATWGNGRPGGFTLVPGYWDFINTSGYSIFGASGGLPLKQDDVLLRWAGRPAEPNQEMRMRCTFGWEVVFNEPRSVQHQRVAETLRSLCDHVGDVVMPQLSQFL